MDFIYCLFCRTQRQRSVALQAARRYQSKVVNPQVRNRRWVGDTARVFSKPLLPGYLFIFSKESIDFSQLRFDISGAIRILRYENGDGNLTPDDRRFAMWLLKYDGTVGTSLAMREGDRIRVISGPMKDFEGSIKRVNKQRRRAEVMFTFDGLTRGVWMDFDWLNQADADDVEALMAAYEKNEKAQSETK